MSLAARWTKTFPRSRSGVSAKHPEVGSDRLPCLGHTLVGLQVGEHSLASASERMTKTRIIILAEMVRVNHAA